MDTPQHPLSPPGTSLGELPRLRDYRVERVSSWTYTGGKGKAFSLPAGQAAVLADLQGPGVITRIWFGIDCVRRRIPFYLRKLVLRAWWDDETEPSIECPLGDFFGVGFGRTSAYHCRAMCMTLGRGQFDGFGSMAVFLPMPFRRRARLELHADTEIDVDLVFYHVDWRTAAPEQVHDMGYLHAQWRRDPCRRPCDPTAAAADTAAAAASNYVLLEAEGRGHYAGSVYSIENLSSGWWGEGMDMIFVDGEGFPPRIHGTGTEEFYNMGFGIQAMHAIDHGTSLMAQPAEENDWRGQYSMYRFHIDDPIPFRQSIRVTLEDGYGNNRSDDVSSVAYWYQCEPHLRFPRLPSVAERVPRHLPA
jgi:hypothetical protein